MTERLKIREYKVGQQVYLYSPQIKRTRVKKLSRLWKGPFTIVKILSNSNLENQNSPEITSHLSPVQTNLEENKPTCSKNLPKLSPINQRVPNQPQQDR